MSTSCSVIQLLEPNPAPVLSISPTDISLPVQEGGKVNLITGQLSVVVVFTQTKISANYNFIQSEVTNIIDGSPISITPTLTAFTNAGFTVQLSAAPDTNNYVYNWEVRVNSV